MVAVLAIALFSAMDAVMKGLTLSMGVYNAMFWRGLIGVLASGILYAAVRSRVPRPATLRLHALRGAVTTVMALCFFWGLARLPLAEAIALSFVAPLVALFLAAAMLGERLGPRSILGSAIGFAGMLVIVAVRARAPHGEESLAGAAAILASALLYAYNIVLMRRQALAAGPVEIAFFQSLTVIALLAPAAPVMATVPITDDLPALGLSAGLALSSALLLAFAYARAEAQQLAPVEYSALVWAALLGALMFGEAVETATTLGAVLIVAGCLIAAQARSGPAAHLP